jgi:hypothetical protein
LDKKQYRAGVPKRRETNEINLTKKLHLLPRLFLGIRHREGDIPAEHGGLTELKRQTSNPTSL